MYRVNLKKTKSLQVNNSYVGESIEERVARLIKDKTPIEDGAPIIFTEKKAGVLPEYNIRTPKWETLVATVQNANKAIANQRAKAMEAKAKDDVGKAETIQGTE